MAATRFNKRTFTGESTMSAISTSAMPAEKLPAPLVGELPYLPRPEQRDLAHYINLQMATGMLVADRVLA